MTETRLDRIYVQEVEAVTETVGHISVLPGTYILFVAGCLLVVSGRTQLLTRSGILSSGSR